jgi:photosystem II stability/assembly factor-like uncharacterized protein
MAKSNRQLARERGITSEQVRILREVRCLSRAAIEVMPVQTLRRAVRRLDYPDMPQARGAFRLLQSYDEQGHIPEHAMFEALRQLDSLRVRQPPRPRVAGVPTGAAVIPRRLAVQPGAAGLAAQSWVPIGPGNIGGRTRAIVIHPGQPQTMWAGSVGGGIWRTDDAGASWLPVDDMMANLAVTCMLMDPNDPNLIYAGTGEGFGNLDAIRGAGIFRTTDGSTWSQIAATAQPRFRYVNRLAVDSDSQVMLVATNAGLFRSTDAGRTTWTRVLSEAIADVKFHPTHPRRAVAGGLDNGTAYRSTDAGLTWQEARHAGAWSGRIELTYATAEPNIVYASINVNNGQIWRSTNGGGRYSRRQSRTPDREPARYLGDQGWYDNVIWAGDPTDADLVIVGGIDLWRSTDSGNTLVDISTWWEPRSAHADHHTIVAHPAYNGTTNRTVFFGNDGGIYRARDVREVGNDSQLPRLRGWQELNNTYGVTQFYGGAGNAVSGVIIGGAQDNGTLAYRPADGSEGWREMFGGDGGSCAADPTNANVFYGEYVFLNVHRNMDGASTNDTEGDRYISGQFWNPVLRRWDWKPEPFRIPDAMLQRALFIAPFVLDPNHANRLLAGGQSLWRTNDATAPNTLTGGPHWARIKPPAGATSLISAIAIAPGDADRIWVGHTDGQVYRTRDGTAANPVWQRLDRTGPNPLQVGRYCTRIVITPQDHDVVFATFGGYRTGNVWRTIDDGSTWQNIGIGLPATPVRALAIHPHRPDWIYLGTEVGVFASEDGGATWSPTNEGPANCACDELFWMGETLVCVTHGRGMFTLDLSQAPHV